ncbi:hypothetical protein ACLKA7_012707 [Drosophila subpalustris]
MAEFEFISEVNNTLRRSRRHTSFVNLWNGSVCYYPDDHPNSSVMCRYVIETPSCSYYVYYIDYLKTLFCTFRLPWNSGYVFVVGFILLFLYGLLFMIFKYFCLPSYLTLMEMLPVSPFAFSFFYFGFSIFMPDYVSLFFDCTFSNSYTASLQFSKVIGDALHFFLVGVMALCINGYHVNGVLLWSSMSFIFLGYIYLLWVVNTKYELFGRHDLVNDYTHMHTMNAWTFVFAFFFVMGLSMLISYYLQRQMRKQKSKSSIFSHSSTLTSEIPSDADISGTNVRIKHMTKTAVWWKTVNGMANLREKNQIVIALLSPFYFIAANMIPVIDMDRPMRGWCKPVAIVSLLVLPFMSLGLSPKPHTLYTLLACSWFFAFVTCISTESLREPSFIWIRIYHIIGIFAYSVSIHTVIGEIDNLIWQFLCMRFSPMPDMIAIVFISTGEILCMSVLLNNLIRRKMLDAAYGAVMSTLAHTIYMALPQLVLQECYTSSIYIMCSSKTATCTVFFMLIFFGTLMHISMSGNEFRMSLFFYLLTLYIAYLLFQLMTYYHQIHFGVQHTIRPPSDSKNVWA